jgi:hypothetical protein
MTKLLISITLFFSFLTLNAQIDLKINPIGSLTLNPNFMAEISATDNLGIEPYVGLTRFNISFDAKKFKIRGVDYGVFIKYYFSQEASTDKFYAGLAFRGGQTNFTYADPKVDSIVSSASTVTKIPNLALTRNRLGVDICIGYKWVTQNNVVFEIGAGLGRKIFNSFGFIDRKVNINTIPFLNLDGFFRFNIGYRFGGGSDNKRV